LVPSDTILGEVRPEAARDLGLPAGVAVITGLNDTQAGAIGAGAFTGDHAAISIGTTGVLVSHVSERRTDIRSAILSMPSPIPDTYFIMAENGLAGGAIERAASWLFQGPDGASGRPDGSSDHLQRLESAARNAPPGSHGTLFLPWLTGSMAPAANDNMRGGFVNLSASTGREDLARSALEGVAYNLRWVRDASERFAKRRFSHLRVYGGGSRSETLCQSLADVLGVPTQRLANSDYTVAIGGALLAFERLGTLTYADMAAAVRTEHSFLPDPSVADRHAVNFEQFKKSYKAQLPIIKSLRRGPRP
jgi:xylulokinase